jgi:hypothetical protein
MLIDTQEAKIVLDIVSNSKIYSDVFLPSYIFKAEYNRFGIRDFYAIFVPEFFSAISKLMKVFANDEVYMAILDPDPFEYYMETRGFLPVFKYSVLDTLNTFLYDLNFSEDIEFGDLSTIAMKVIIFPSSGNWIIYLDRENDIALFGINYKEEEIDIQQDLSIFSFSYYEREDEAWKATAKIYKIPPM